MATGAIVGLGLLAVVLFIFFWLIIIGLIIFCFVFWIFMIVDVAKRKFKQDADKIAWVLIVILTGIIGALIYYFVIKRKDNH